MGLPSVFFNAIISARGVKHEILFSGRIMARKKFSEKTTAGKIRSIIGKVLLFAMLACLLVLIVGGIWFYNKYGARFFELRDEAKLVVAGSTRDTFKSTETSICYFADGSVMQELKNEKNSYYIPYSSIPANAVNAMLATEDRKFFSHSGYDISAIARAAIAYIENDGEIRQGGSTITQQLARGVFLTNEKTVERKASEIFIAAELEKKYTKEDILEFYFNTIYFASGYYGIQTASIGYFGKGVGALSLSQLAYLCGIPNSPTLYNPRVNPQKTIERRNSVLEQMKDNGFITQEQYEEALAEQIILVEAEPLKYDYEETYAYYCAVRSIMAAEGFVFRTTFEDEADEAMYRDYYNEEYYRTRNNLYLKGYRIYTSLNPEKQEMLQRAIDEGTADFTSTNEEGVYELQAAATCIDNETGFVVAIVGGRSQDIEGYTLNRAYQSPRQPGSSIKPLIVYTPCFENGYYPDTTVVDERFSGGPRNSGGVYSGEIDIKYAVTVSKNTVAWKLFGELGIDKGLSYLKKMGFSHIVDEDYVPAAALGGLTYGVTTVEMASGYEAIEQQGLFRSPTCIVRITDSQGNAIVDNTGAAGTLGTNTMEEKRIYDSNATLMMTDCLQNVMKVGTGKKLKLENVTSAGKTGTTNDQKDGWFCGFTQYYTTAVWVGYDMPREMDDLMGNTYPGRIWNAYMEMIHEDLEDRPFDTYFDPRPPADDEDEEEEEIEIPEEELIEEGFFLDDDLAGSYLEGDIEGHFYAPEGDTDSNNTQTGRDTDSNNTQDDGQAGNSYSNYVNGDRDTSGTSDSNIEGYYALDEDNQQAGEDGSYRDESGILWIKPGSEDIWN